MLNISTHASERVRERLGNPLSAEMLTQMWEWGRPVRPEDGKRFRARFIFGKFSYRVAHHRGRRVLLVCSRAGVLVTVRTES